MLILFIILGTAFFGTLASLVGANTVPKTDAPDGGSPGATKCEEAKAELEQQKQRVDSLESSLKRAAAAVKAAAITLAVATAAAVAAGVAAAVTFGALAAAAIAAGLVAAGALGALTAANRKLEKVHALLDQARRALRGHENAVKKLCP